MSEIDINKRINWDEIDKNISKDYEFVNSMLELVPPEHYFPQEMDISKLNDRWMRRKKSKKEIEKGKVLQKKMKFQKFDPDNYKSVPQVLLEKGGFKSEENGVNSEENDEKIENDGGSIRKIKIIHGFSSNGLKDREELKKRLMEKIDHLKNKRKAEEAIDEERQVKRQRTNKKKKKKTKDSFYTKQFNFTKIQ